MRILNFILFCFLFLPQDLLADSCKEAESLIRKGVELADGSSEEETFYLKALEKCSNSIEAKFNLGLLYLKNDRLDKAEKYLEETIKTEKKEDFLIALAELKIKTADLDSARQIYSEVLENKGKNIKAMQGLAIVYDKLGQFERAQEYLGKALAIEPKNKITLFNLAVLSEQQKKWDEAQKYYQEVIDVDSEDYNSLLALGLLNKKLHHLDQAKAYLKQALEIMSNNASLYRALGEVYEKLSENDRAEIMFSKAMELEPNNIDLAINLAITKIKTKHAAQSITLLKASKKTLKEKDQRMSKVLSVMAWAYMELGEYAKAETYFKKSLKADPSQLSVHYNLGVLYERMGKKSEAEAEYSIANKKNNNRSDPL